MKEVLFLVHRMPYPPNKGDKIRSFHILRYLATHYAVHLGTFIDDPGDNAYRREVEALCASTCFVPLHPIVAKLRSLSGFATGEALTIPYYRNDRLERYVQNTLSRRNVEAAVAFSSSMAPYLVDQQRPCGRTIVDFVDVDSDKWRQYAQGARWPASRIYGREGHYLAKAERRFAERSDASLLVSEADAALMRELAPSAADRIVALPNGVDTDYFDPARTYENPFRTSAPTLVFTGAMDYRANVDAVRWLATEALALVRERCPTVRFIIVGARPAKAVRILEALPNVRVTGSVPDVRPYLAHASLVVAPLRIARGIQNKVLEAMAMGKAVVASSSAAQGLDSLAPLARLKDDSTEELARTVTDLLTTPGRLEDLARAARPFVIQHYNWERNLSRLGALLDSGDNISAAEAPAAGPVPVEAKPL